MTRFMSPLTASVLLTRQATKRPIPAKAKAHQEFDANHERQAAPDRHVEHQLSQEEQHSQVGDHESEPRAQEREQEIASGHGGGDESLEKLGDAEIDQQKADAPQPSAHRIQSNQTRN